MMMPEDVHQRTSQKKQKGRSGKSVARMRREQVESECCRNDSHGQAKPSQAKPSQAKPSRDARNPVIVSIGLQPLS
jgi:hypothetical protein